ncbi:MAG: glycosyl hydrolase, partial [Opitutaceae bacterium]
PSANNGRGTTIDIRQVVIPGTPEHTEFIAQIDIVAGELKKLRDARVPVIWRPMHECSGGWFWWGANGATAFKQAWRIMFDRYTQLHGLNNIIWCYNPTDSTTRLAEWYPGDDVVDAISLDVYPNPGTQPTYAADFQRMRDFKTNRKVLAMSENGTIPHPDNFFTEGAGWSYFCTWNGFENDLSRNSVVHIRNVFNHPKVITLDELPPLYQARVFNIQSHPQPQLAVVGAPLALSVTARDDGPLTYQWSKNGIAIPGATAATHSVATATAADAGDYTVAVTGALGTLKSDPATVTIAATDTGRIVNLSVRATAGTGAQTLIAGFVLAGSASEELVIRAVGPTLALYGIPSGFQIDPALRLDVVDGIPPPTTTNDDWGSSTTSVAAFNNAFASVGAFALGNGSKDAALFGPFSPGNYSAAVNLASGGPGIALVEIYDRTPTTGSRLVNVSTRSQVGGGADLIAGFVISGDTRTVLVRAVGGKTLTDFGVAGSLANPRLEIYREGTAAPIATNDEWTQTSLSFRTLGTFFDRVGAFGLDNGSRDAVLLLNLPPANYSAQVKSADNTAGVGLIEIYEVR